MSFWVTTKRVARYGLIGFIRNGFVSLAAVSIMTITLFVIASLFISGAALNAVLSELTNNVDVAVYFTTSATPDQIASVQQSLQALPQVASVQYVSSDEALAQFEQRHQNDQLTMQALQELGGNPLGASLQIRAKDPSQYATIAQYLQQLQESNTPAGSSIDTVNFFQNKTAIDKLTGIITAMREIGVAAALFFGATSLLIAFNTIRLAIYTARDEIGVMSLVGASHWYVRGPFVVGGILYGIIAGLIVLLVLYPLCAWLGPSSQNFFGTFNVFNYYIGAFPLLFLAVMGSGVALGGLSSFLAVHRYLKA